MFWIRCIMRFIMLNAMRFALLPSLKLCLRLMIAATFSLPCMRAMTFRMMRRAKLRSHSSESGPAYSQGRGYRTQDTPYGTQDTGYHIQGTGSVGIAIIRVSVAAGPWSPLFAIP